MKLLQVRWKGIGVRDMGAYSWNPANDFIQEVPLEMAAELITYPGNQFELVDPEQVSEVVTFVEGDPRPIEDLKRRKSRPSTTSRKKSGKNKRSNA